MTEKEWTGVDTGRDDGYCEDENKRLCHEDRQSG